jgi:hypothetical protein
MNFILGFGSTEEELEKKEVDKILSFTENLYTEKKKNDSCFIVNKDFIGEVEFELKKTEDEYKEAYEENKLKEIKDRPERYSIFDFNVVHDYRDICIVFRFMHINTRHPMSLDGMACLQTVKIAHLDVYGL